MVNLAQYSPSKRIIVVDIKRHRRVLEVAAGDEAALEAVAQKRALF